MTLNLDLARTTSRSDFIWMCQVEVFRADGHRSWSERKTQPEVGALRSSSWVPSLRHFLPSVTCTFGHQRAQFYARSWPGQ